MKVEYCYNKGDLDLALLQAAEFVKKIGDKNVLHVIARVDEQCPGAWWVDVIYNEASQ